MMSGVHHSSGARPVPGAARRAHGTMPAPGASGGADQCAQIHQRLVELPGSTAAHGEEAGGEILQLAKPARAATEPRTENPGQDTRYVGVDRRDPLLERKRGHGTGGVCSNARQAPQPVGMRWDLPTVLANHGPREGVQVGGAPVVSQPIPTLANGAGPGPREIGNGGIPIQEPGVIVPDPSDLRLLQHELGYDDTVRIACGTPRKVAAAAAEPAEQSALERYGVGGNPRRHNRRRYANVRVCGTQLPGTEIGATG